MSAPQTRTEVFSEEVLAAVSVEAAKEVRDARKIQTPFLDECAAVHGKGKPVKDTAQRWMHAWNIGEHSQPTRIRTGYERPNLGVSGVLVPMILNPGEVMFPILFSEKEEDIFGDRLAQTDALTQRIKSVMGAAMRKFEQNCWQGGVVGFEDFLSLNGDDNADGILESTAPGGQNNVIGGFSKATYQSLPGTQNQAGDAAGDFSTNGLLQIWEMAIRAKTRGDGETDKLRCFFSEKGLRNYKASVQTNERYVVEGGKDPRLDASILELYVQGIKARPAPYMPNAGTATTADPWTMAIINIGGVYPVWTKVKRDGYFGMSDFKDIGNGYSVKMAKVTVNGQMWPSEFASSCILIDGEVL